MVLFTGLPQHDFYFRYHSLDKREQECKSLFMYRSTDKSIFEVNGAIFTPMSKDRTESEIVKLFNQGIWRLCDVKRNHVMDFHKARVSPSSKSRAKSFHKRTGVPWNATKSLSQRKFDRIVDVSNFDNYIMTKRCYIQHMKAFVFGYQIGNHLYYSVTKIGSNDKISLQFFRTKVKCIYVQEDIWAESTLDSYDYPIIALYHKRGDSKKTIEEARIVHRVRTEAGKPTRDLEEEAVEERPLPTMEMVNRMKETEIAKEWTNKHYSFDHKIEIDDTDVINGFVTVKVDPYFVNKVWRVNAVDDTGALFHTLKTIARFGSKNSVEREIRAIHAQNLRMAELYGIEL